MIKYFSQIKKDMLLHFVFKKNEFESRKDLISEENFLQLASIKLKKDQTFKPHMHKFNPINLKEKIAQESWVIIEGSVEVTFYDLDKSILGKNILKKGDCSVTLFGGHNYRSLNDDTLVYEFKTGPYEGVSKDKIFI